MTREDIMRLLNLKYAVLTEYPYDQTDIEEFTSLDDAIKGLKRSSFPTTLAVIAFSGPLLDPMWRSDNDT